MFVDREKELSALNKVLKWNGAQFATLYGRRRVGKTALLLEWARRSQVPYLYWVAARESSAMLLRSFSQAVYNHARPDQPADGMFTYPSWEMALREAANLGRTERVILILDEFPYAAQSEPALPSLLQNAWDHAFKPTQTVLVIAGSQISMMMDLMAYHAPLYGRMTAQMAIQPLPFGALAQFFPRYPAAERMAVYAILGGIPAYLEKFSDRVPLGANVREQILTSPTIFQNEPLFLLQDEVRETANFLAILRAIGEGGHTLDDITKLSGVAKNHASAYLDRLQELYFVRRETPVTIPEGKRTTQGRYVLADAYLRFYFRFLAPHRTLLEQGLINRLWEHIAEGLRAFVGGTAFEEVSRTWTLQQAVSGQLPFIPDAVGSHWAKDAQVDVVAINWQEKAILLGECKWGSDEVARSVIRELVEKTPLVVPGNDWQVHYAFFARSGFTQAAIEEAATLGAQLIDLARLDQDLSAGIQASA